MRNDEFNKIEVTNEKQLRGIEFGKTQKFEATSQKENKSPKGELNEKYVGKTIRKQTEVNVQYTNKTTVSSHGSATVTSSTTTTSVAATTASVATAASVVAVTAIAVGTGISVALHGLHRHVVREPGDAAEVFEINDETGIHLLGIERLDQLHGRSGGASGSEQVVVHQHYVVGGDGVGVFSTPNQLFNKC